MLKIVFIFAQVSVLVCNVVDVMILQQFVVVLVVVLSWRRVLIGTERNGWKKNVS